MNYKIFIFFLMLFLQSCGNNSVNAVKIFDATVATITAGVWYKPATDTSWQWQLKNGTPSGTINTTYSVDVYDIDLFDASTATITALQGAGKKVICYFSGGSWENWRADKDDFPADALGNVMDGWADEKWLDVSNEALAPVMRARLDLAKSKGCDGVEPDNMDGYLADNFSPTGTISATDQLAYNKFMANEARIRGLSVGLKNDLEQVEELEPYFNFAVNEQCHEFDECNKLQPFISNGKPVWAAEYPSGGYINEDGTGFSATATNAMCLKAKSLGHKTLVLPLDLADGFRYDCADAPF